MSAHNLRQIVINGERYGFELNLEDVRQLYTALQSAVEVIKTWHGPDAFEIYYRAAPEMKLIREMLGPRHSELVTCNNLKTCWQCYPKFDVAVQQTQERGDG